MWVTGTFMELWAMCGQLACPCIVHSGMPVIHMSTALVFFSFIAYTPVFAWNGGERRLYVKLNSR